MNAASLHANSHEPGWAAGIADLADRAASAFALAGIEGCFTVVDLQPWRLLDAWWLRRRLEPLAHLSGRRVRYVPCIVAGSVPRAQSLRAIAPAWSVGAAPVELAWPSGSARPQRKGTAQDWTADGAVLLLAGDLAQRLPQDLLLSHHGRANEWGGPPDAREWQRIDCSRYDDWIAESAKRYLQSLPSSMFSLPVGYWKFLEHALAWGERGCIVVARAAGWSSLAQIRDDAATRAHVSADCPPVNFHWLADHAQRLRASAHTLRAVRADTIQVLASGLPGGESMLPLLCGTLTAATRSTREDVAQAIRVLAANGEMNALLSVLQQSADDPILLRAVWDRLVPAATSAKPAEGAALGAWLERMMHDNPWIGDDEELLRAAGHVALACERPGLARSALETLHEKRRASANDLAALALTHEKLGALGEAIATCDQALLRQSGHPEALATRERATARLATMAGGWHVQHAGVDSPLMLDPLHAGHARVLARQLRDPSITTMTVLPALAPDDDGTQWIRARLEDGGPAYALIHRQLGFVGSLELRLWESTAFLSCWIGADYQGLGFYGPALALARDLALKNGIDLILSAAFDDNVRSLRGLRKCGFRVMNEVRAVPPDDDRTFLMLCNQAMDDDEALRRLVDFCNNTNSGLRFTAQAGATPSATPSATNPSGETP